MIGHRHPTHYNSNAPPLQHPSERGRQLLVDCCLSSSNGGQLRPEPCVSLYFLMCLHLAPQIGNPAIAPPNPTTGALRGTRGSRGAIGWGHRYSAHGERGQSRWRVGWQPNIGKNISYPRIYPILGYDISILPQSEKDISILLTFFSLGYQDIS
jgi:hypothetical protein